MRIRSIVLERLELDLEQPLRTSGAEHAHRPVLVVRVETDDAWGCGECSALAEPTYTEEYADGAELVLADHLIPRVLALGELAGTADARDAMDAVRSHAMAKAGLEMAVLDAELRASGTSLAAWLGASATDIPAGANLSIGTPASVVAAAAEVVHAGYRRVKCKIAPGHDVEIVTAVRGAFPDLVVSVDANGAYALDKTDDLRALHALDALGLAALEQPLAPEDLVGHARLAAELLTPVVLDESIPSLGALEIALALGACDGVSVKLARLGGVLVARRVHDRCLDAGVHLTIGGMLETGIGRAAAIALAALPGFDLPGDLGASDRYFVPDLTPPHLLLEGCLAVPTGAGLGIDLDETAVSAARVSVRHFGS